MRPGLRCLVFVLAAFCIPPAVLAENWPQEFATDGYKVVMYQPQPDALEGNVVTGRTAVSVLAKDQKEPVFGAVFLTAKLDIDREKDIARVLEVKVDRVRFPDVKPDDPRAQKLAALLEREIPRLDLEISVTDLITALEPPPEGDKGLKNDPPVIIVVDHPAILVSFDGEPRLQAIPNTTYKRVVNTPFPIVQDPEKGRYYLYGSLVWFTTKDLLKEEWKPTDDPPKKMAELFKDPNQPAQKPPDAGQGLSKDQLKKAKIYTATKPTELIVTDGPPQYKPLVEGEVLYVTNTEDYLLMEVSTQKHYTVLSGRWYSAPGWKGPWTFVYPDTLPKTFAKIPKNSPKAGVLAHVPGTDEAKDAMMDAIIPQTASVKKGPAKFEAKYDGEPKFEPIEGTKLKYAVNTPSQIILADGKYYAVEQGVWFISDSPKGPWKVSDTRPVGIEEIPASSPVYNTKYVYIYDTTPETVVVGYTPGYTYVYPYYGTVVYGTGWYYPPWYGTIYYPRPCTWGFHVGYNPYTGWGFGMSWSVGWMTISVGWGGGWGGWYGPVHGPSYGAGFWHGYHAGSHPGGWFGPGGYHPRADPYRGGQGRPGTGTGASQLPAGGAGGANRPSQLPAGGGAGASQRPANIYGKPENANLGARPAQRPASPSGGVSTRPSQLPNNVYAGKDGSVGRYDQGSGWQTRDQGSWSSGSGSGSRPSQQPSAGQRPSQQPSRPSSSYPSASARGGGSYDASRASRSRSMSMPRGGGGGGRRR